MKQAHHFECDAEAIERRSLSATVTSAEEPKWHEPNRALRPLPPDPPADACPPQMFGDVWEWTQSA